MLDKPPAAAGTNTVLAVLVVYRQTPRRSKAWPFLQVVDAASAPELGAHEAPRGLQLRHVLIYDNSQSSEFDGPYAANISYTHDPANRGTAGAYAKAFALAEEQGCQWVLLLDQDTVLPADYLGMALSSLQELPAQQQGVLLAPWVTHQGRAISPTRLSRWGGMVALTPNMPGLDSAEISCIASGCLLDRAARAMVGDFPPELWLDFVDHWMVRRIRKEGAVIGLINTTIAHDLSIEAPTQLSASRQQSLLAGERYFISQCAWPARACLPFRLAWRALRYAVTGAPHWRLVLQAIK